MSKGLQNSLVNTLPYEKRNNSRDFREEDAKMNDRNTLPKNINPINDAKQEYDLKDKDIEDIEKLTNSKIICNIGYGGFSTVKLIFNNQQKSYFAMKVVNLKNKKFKKKTTSKNREFIYQEILVNFNTRNHNIIKLYGYFNHKEYVLLILEYMNNRDLKYFMKKFHSKYIDVNFSEVLAAYFINQILKALGYLKIRNILHRDIKPENIMLNSNYVSKLGDFSLSRKIDMNNNFKTSRSGTLPYLSPECVKKKLEIKPYLCEKLDLFSLGVVMYFLLFNRHPYNYRNQMNVKDYSKKLDESSLNFEGNNITKQCKNFLNGLLEKNIHKRFSYEQAVNHPWIVLIKEKVDEITSNYSSDPDKMIHELNKCIVTNGFFESHKNYLNLNEYEVKNINSNILKKANTSEIPIYSNNQNSSSNNYTTISKATQNNSNGFNNLINNNNNNNIINSCEKNSLQQNNFVNMSTSNKLRVEPVKEANNNNYLINYQNYNTYNNISQTLPTTENSANNIFLQNIYLGKYNNNSNNSGKSTATIANNNSCNFINGNIMESNVNEVISLNNNIKSSNLNNHTFISNPQQQENLNMLYYQKPQYSLNGVNNMNMMNNNIINILDNPNNNYNFNNLIHNPISNFNESTNNNSSINNFNINITSPVNEYWANNRTHANVNNNVLQTQFLNNCTQNKISNNIINFSYIKGINNNPENGELIGKKRNREAEIPQINILRGEKDINSISILPQNFNN